MRDTSTAAICCERYSGDSTLSVAGRFREGLDEPLRATFTGQVADVVALARTHFAGRLASNHGVTTVALSGGVFQNKTLFEAIAQGLRQQGLRVLTHRRVPANDGGLALGQAVAAAAKLIALSSPGF